jgi:hypothetical protein
VCGLHSRGEDVGGHAITAAEETDGAAALGAALARCAALRTLHLERLWLRSAPVLSSVVGAAAQSCGGGGALTLRACGAPGEAEDVDGALVDALLTQRDALRSLHTLRVSLSRDTHPFLMDPILERLLNALAGSARLRVLHLSPAPASARGVPVRVAAHALARLVRATPSLREVRFGEAGAPPPPRGSGVADALQALAQRAARHGGR